MNLMGYGRVSFVQNDLKAGNALLFIEQGQTIGMAVVEQVLGVVSKNSSDS